MPSAESWILLDSADSTCLSAGNLTLYDGDDSGVFSP